MRLPGSPRLRSLAAMYLMHAANLGWPLVTIPFLTRALGPEGYGVYGLVLTWSAFAALFAEFGLGVLGTKRIAAHDAAQRDHDLVRVVASQLVNGALVTVPLVIAMVLHPMAGGGLLTCLLAVGVMLATALSPLWFYIAGSAVTGLLPAVLVSKVVSAALVVVLLPARPSIDLALFAYLLSWGWSFAGLWRWRRAIAARLRAFDWADHRAALRAIVAVPLQRVGTALYTLAPATVAATYFGLAAGAMYLLAERIVRALMGLFQPITSHLMPMQIAAARPDADPARRAAVRRWIVGSIATSALFAAAVGWGGEPLAVLVGGPRFQAAGGLIRILSPLIVLVTINGICANRLYALDAESVLTKVVWACGLLFVIALATLGNTSIERFTLWCMLVELGITVGLLAALWRRHRAARSAAPQGEPVPR